jgi:ElaB/YqjD/DUF883 family membrane-anchored ribosome-binding protein
MADQNNSSSTPAGSGVAGGEVTFDADTKLEADTGAADVSFAPADDLGATDEAQASGAKPSATQQLKDEASKFGSQAADRARAFAGEGKERATTALDDVARMFQSAADDVDAKLGADYGKYARTAADSISGFAESLRGKEVDDLIDDASDFVRKSPAIAVGTAAAVGFVLARLIKSGIDAAGDLNAPSGTTGTDAA